MTRILGADISLNHGAVVLIERGKLIDYRYYTTIVSAADRNKQGTRLNFEAMKKKDKQSAAVERIAFVESWFNKALKDWAPKYAGLEDYAIHAEYQTHQLGEVGGAVRVAMWKFGVPFRLSDPTSSKMFVTHDGGAQKDLVERFVRERWGADFSACNGKAQKGKEPKRTSSEDLADAFGLAKLVQTEVRLRSGKLTLRELHAKEIRVFNRTTKTYPTNILDRPFIQRDELREAG